MIRAYDDQGNVVDLVEWEKKIRADAFDEMIDKCRKYAYVVHSSEFAKILEDWKNGNFV